MTIFGIFIDLQKTFDTVNHDIRLTKLTYVDWLIAGSIPLEKIEHNMFIWMVIAPLLN